MTIYYNFNINRNQFSYSREGTRVNDSAYTTLNKIEYILTHFQSLTYTGQEVNVHLRLKPIALTVVNQYRERQRNIHWLVYLIFYICIAIKYRKIEKAHSRIQAIEVAPVLPPPQQPPRPTQLPEPLPIVTLPFPQSTSVAIKPKPAFSFPFDKNKDAWHFMLGYLDLRAIACFGVCSKQMHALATPIRQQIERPVLHWIYVYKHTRFNFSNPKENHLFIAAKTRQMQDQVHSLLLLGADPDKYKDRNNDRAIHWAAYNGDVDTLTLLLRYRAQVDPPGFHQETPLTQTYGQYHPARQATHLAAMKLLLENRANPNPSIDNTPLLNIAIREDKSEAVKLLLSFKADHSLKDAEGNTALHEAAALGNIVILRLLFDAGAATGINQPGKGRQPPLWIAYLKLRAERRIDAMQLLLQKGANADIRDTTGKALICISAFKGEKDLLELLIDHKANINHIYGQFTPLGYACGADYRHRNYNGQHVSNLHLVKLLLERGANPRIGALGAKLPVVLAEEYGLNQIAEVLWKRMPPLFRAIYKVDIARMNQILEKDPLKKVNRPSMPGGKGETTPLFFAYISSQAASKQHTMQLLLEKNADPDVRDSNDEALVDHMAWKAERSLLEMMIRHGAKLNQPGFTPPLSWACQNREPNQAIIRLLLDQGANPHQEANGVLPVHQLQLNGQFAIADMLMQHPIAH